MNTLRDRVIALAGIFQACKLVEQIGRDGRCESEVAKSSLYSLLQVDAENVAAVYGGIEGVATGLRTIKREMTAKSARNPYITQYAIQLLHLEGKLRKSSRHLDTIGQGIEEVRQRQEHFSYDHPNSIARFADIYLNTISALGPRIMVKGETVHLNNPDNANQIRALLLAGIRSAMLWRQCGGGRLQIIFGRKRILNEAGKLIDSLTSNFQT